MTNHTIKAKNKNSQEIRDINVIDEGDNFVYYDDEYKTYYDLKKFNDLFEVVEDNTSKYWYSKENDNIPQTDTLKKEDWELDFDNDNQLAKDLGYAGYTLSQVFEIKQRIRNAVTQEIAKAKEEIVEKIKKNKTMFDNSEWSKGYEDACDDIINLIQNNK